MHVQTFVCLRAVFSVGGHAGDLQACATDMAQLLLWYCPDDGRTRTTTCMFGMREVHVKPLAGWLDGAARSAVCCSGEGRSMGAIAVAAGLTSVLMAGRTEEGRWDDGQYQEHLRRSALRGR